jgi:hypothetical protein
MPQNQPSITLQSGYKMPQFGLGTWLSKPGEVGQAVKWALEAGTYTHTHTPTHINVQDIDTSIAHIAMAIRWRLAPP